MRTVGRYIIRGLLGRGGMSKVYKVSLPAIGKITALKLLDPDPVLVQLLGLSQIRRQFEKEAITMAGVHHPNIVSIHDFDDHEGRPFYVMDFFVNNLGMLMGETAQVENASRVIPADKALKYIRQTIAGIGCLHDAGIVHRDIKPFNLLITDNDTIKIGDFGLSKLRGESYTVPSHLNVGSPYYAAPEQEANPNLVDGRVDLFAVGVILYRMLTGLLPDMMGNAPLPASQLNSDLDRYWDEFLAQSMMPDPRKRFPDARTMLRALDELTHHWHSRKAHICDLSQLDPPLKPQAPPKGELRSNPIKSRPGYAAAHFGTDSLWRPKAYIANEFEARNDAMVIDHATALVWQQSGSEYPRTWQGAATYIEHLNATEFGGYTSWRLPTISELISLLRPPPKSSELCIPPVFDTTQRWIWSADRSSFISAYYVDIALGFVGWQDFSAPFFVRAVATLAGSVERQQVFTRRASGTGRTVADNTSKTNK